MSPGSTQQSVESEVFSKGKEQGSQPVSNAIATQNLTFHYPNCEPVLDDISLVVHSSQRLGIIGHNGCGKTTLFMLLCGVLAPTAGEILLLNQPVEPGEFHPEVAMLFQDPDDQLFSPTVREDVAFGPQNMGLDPETAAARVNQALERYRDRIFGRSDASSPVRR